MGLRHIVEHQGQNCTPLCNLAHIRHFNEKLNHAKGGTMTFFLAGLVTIAAGALAVQLIIYSSNKE